MTTDTIYCVDYTTMDHYSAEKEFNGPDALRNACVFAQGIEEDGGSAHVTDQEGNGVDHWDGYRVSITPEGRLALGHNITGVHNGTSSS